MTMPRVEVITSLERRRRWSHVEKERLVAASLEAGVSVSEVARSAGIHVSQLFRWRKDLCDRVDGGSSQLVPVEIAPPAVASPAVEVPASSASPGRRRRKSGIIEIELGGGHRVRVDRDVDAEALRRVLDVLGPR
ncbi:IS66-like element accessory protein TnpA [Mesorhizobium sp. IMUNJ 23232]|uniref:IS66-like element accessory protein TnpA n=1 Tax=Mesorhizobium sp. IMUNJ 23232 TaxID=3376064 RepID=UPI003793530A